MTKAIYKQRTWQKCLWSFYLCRLEVKLQLFFLKNIARENNICFAFCGFCPSSWQSISQIHTLRRLLLTAVLENNKYLNQTLHLKLVTSVAKTFLAQCLGLRFSLTKKWAGGDYPISERITGEYFLTLKYIINLNCQFLFFHLFQQFKLMERSCLHNCLHYTINNERLLCMI